MAYQDMFTEEDIAAYRAKKDAEAAEAAKSAEAAAKETHKKARANLETSLKTKFIAAGGTESEWLGVKRQVVEKALVDATLATEPVLTPEERERQEQLAKIKPLQRDF